MAVKVSQCGSDNFGSGISGNKNSHMVKAHDFASRYFPAAKKSVSGGGKKMHFKDVSGDGKFEIIRKVLFKPEDGISNMAFSNSVKIKLKASGIKSEEARRQLEVIMDNAMAETKVIIAEYESPQG